MMLFSCFFFFFSSRRRHTRWNCDWSSDVCSSDLEGKAVPPDLHERIRGLQKEYDAHQHEIAGAANADLTERWGLTDFLRDRFGIAGTPDDCVAQVRRAMAAGARQFIITAFVPDVRALMRRFMREVAAAVGTPA